MLVCGFEVTQQVRDRQKAERSERQLHAERARFQQVFANTPALIALLHGPTHEFTYVNPAFQRYFSGRQLVGRSYAEALPDAHAQGYGDLLNQVYATGETFLANESRLRSRAAGGQEREDYFNFTYEAYGESAPEGIFIYAFEVTEKVLARKAMEKSAQQLRLITDALPALIGYLDRQEKYRFTNRAYQDWFGQPPEALLGRPVREVVGEQAYQGVKGYIERALAGERLDFEARMPYRENFIKHIRTSFVPDIQEGEVVGFYSMVTDVTHQVNDRRMLEESQQQALKLAEALSIANGQLLRTNVDLDTFVYTASHDLRAPINNIQGLLGLLSRSVAVQQDENTSQLLAMADQALAKLMRVIDDLTEIATVQKDIDGEKEPISFREMLQDVLAELEQPIRTSKTRISLRIETEYLVYSRKNLRSILHNLLSNALKYRSPERIPEVSLTFGMMDENPVLVVADNGLGLRPEQVAKLFSIYKRFHHHVEGTGIGLYMIKRMVENAGGQIEVSSQIDQGTTFTVYFKR